jgi:hypothetical protein
MLVNDLFKLAIACSSVGFACCFFFCKKFVLRLFWSELCTQVDLEYKEHVLVLEVTRLRTRRVGKKKLKYSSTTRVHFLEYFFALFIYKNFFSNKIIDRIVCISHDSSMPWTMYPSKQRILTSVHPSSDTFGNSSLATFFLFNLVTIALMNLMPVSVA